MIDLPQENYPNEAQVAKSSMDIQVSRTTLGENIEHRIAQHRDAIARLEKVRDTLKTGTILDVSMSDLQHAMRW